MINAEQQKYLFVAKNLTVFRKTVKGGSGSAPSQSLTRSGSAVNLDQYCKLILCGGEKTETK